MTERRIDHIAMAVKLETNTPILRARRISLLGYDPAERTTHPDALVSGSSTGGVGR